jgi:threonine dehydrogenase-like Zn-dependent dehydrogenase
MQITGKGADTAIEAVGIRFYELCASIVAPGGTIANIESWQKCRASSGSYGRIILPLRDWWTQ